MEEKLVSEVRKELGHYPDLSLVQLAAALQARDSYGRASVSSPQLRSVLRAEGVSLSNKATEQSGVLYAFPPCSFSLDLLRRVAKALPDESSKDDHLVVVAVRGT